MGGGNLHLRGGKAAVPFPWGACMHVDSDLKMENSPREDSRKPTNRGMVHATALKTYLTEKGYSNLYLDGELPDAASQPGGHQSQQVGPRWTRRMTAAVPISFAFTCEGPPTTLHTAYAGSCSSCSTAARRENTHCTD